MRRVWTQCWAQRSTALLCYQTTWQAVNISTSLGLSVWNFALTVENVWYENIKKPEITKNKSIFLSNLRVSSLHWGLFSPRDSSSTPESCRSLLFRSSSIILNDWQLRTEARASQLSFDRLQPPSLKKQEWIPLLQSKIYKKSSKTEFSGQNRPFRFWRLATTDSERPIWIWMLSHVVEELLPDNLHCTQLTLKWCEEMHDC